MDYTEDIQSAIALIEECSKKMGMTQKTFSLRFLSDVHLYDRLKGGSKRITVEKLERILDTLNRMKGELE